jgi:hypothetical protein
VLTVATAYRQLLHDGIVFAPDSVEWPSWEALSRQLKAAAGRDGLRAVGLVGCLAPWNDVAFGPFSVVLTAPDGEMFDLRDESIGPYEKPRLLKIVSVLRPQIEAAWGDALVAARASADEAPPSR